MARASELTKCGTIKDTDKACGRYPKQTCDPCDYIDGLCPPHYPVPAIASLMPLANPVVIYGLANNLWAQ